MGIIGGASLDGAITDLPDEQVESNIDDFHDAHDEPFNDDDLNDSSDEEAADDAIGGGCADAWDDDTANALDASDGEADISDQGIQALSVENVEATGIIDIVSLSATALNETGQSDEDDDEEEEDEEEREEDIVGPAVVVNVAPPLPVVSSAPCAEP